MELRSSRRHKSILVIGFAICLTFVPIFNTEVIAQAEGPPKLVLKRSPFFQTGSFFIHEPPVTNWSNLEKDHLDIRVLKWVYSFNSPIATTWMASADRVAYPVLFGMPVAVWAAQVLGGNVPQTDAVRVSGAWLGAAAGALVLKAIIKRPRPYDRVTGITAKQGYPGARGLDAQASMPSGHAAISFALATALSIQEPRWYVVAPSTFAATSIAVSRIWLGVHYPSDVLSGAALGVASALLVHRLVK